MSVTFCIAGKDWDSLHGQFVNVSNTNARDILKTLNISHEDLFGSMRSRDLKKKCEIALKNLNVSNNADMEIPGHTAKELGKAQVIHCGREAGYLASRIQQLMQLCEKAGDIGIIQWS